MSLIYERKERVTILTLNRPEALNALDPETYQEFSDACMRFRDDPGSWVAIITGAGDKAFCAGADLKKSIPAVRKGAAVPPSIRRGLTIYKPFIAAINGLAIGGGVEMALACDLRIASDRATFTMGEVRWGLMPGQGGTQRLPRLIGMARAAELMYLAKTIDAAEALRIGLVNTVVAPQEVLSTALEWAGKICENSPLAIQKIKKAMVEGLHMSLDQGLELEDSLVKSLLTSQDAQEGLSAFKDKRRPVFKGE
jgi:enoyl-CoA hydratase/carnithine racemase